MQRPRHTRQPLVFTAFFCVFVSLCFVTGCIPYSSDNVRVGDICTGKPGCISSAHIIRDGVGRTRIDFSLTNNGKDQATVLVELTVPGESDHGPPTTLEILGIRSYVVAAGETTGDRFTALEDGTRREVNLLLICDKCDVTLEYVVGIEPLQCRKDNECGSGWLCEETRGICVECNMNSDCKPEQTCAANGLCTPAEKGTSCSTLGTSSGSFATSILLILLGLFVFRLPRRVTPR